jgi:mRNA-degrading endonuclease RelE of RelBE toxin-antitoxin system
VAPPSPRVVWTREARFRFEDLASPIRAEILQKIAVVETHPRMYQVEPGGRWAGLRRFRVHNWKVYYAFWEAENTIYIEVLWPARAADAPDE